MFWVRLVTYGGFKEVFLGVFVGLVFNVFVLDLGGIEGRGSVVMVFVFSILFGIYGV